MKKPTAQQVLGNEQGYTVIEVLVALLILFIVLIPVTQIFSYVLSNQANVDKVHATMLAEKEMETSLLNKLFYEDEYVTTVNTRNYRISRTIKKEADLVFITIEVNRENKKKPIVRFYRYYLNDIKQEY
ncbi:MAG: hypothetical protein GWN00_35915 [Aliifodinibius sp.]|nr:hypothetical protein [Fodinibius sp.]NIV16025.1 hypothetical protein [Fodinibius sp.]NIY29982.1 hypothetical protein [Fodinibius sp.]